MNTSKQINTMIVLLSLLLVLIGAYTVWDPFRAEAEDKRTREKIAERAAHTYARNCRVCHGNAGEGRIGPALNPETRASARATNPSLIDFTDPNKRAENQSLVKNIITCGRLGTIMPPWAQEQGGGLNDEQIRQLVILITENPSGEGWKKVAQISAEEDRIALEGMTLKDLQEAAAKAGIVVPGGLTKTGLIDLMLRSGYTTLADVAEVTKGASTTGASAPVCGQTVRAAPTPTPTPPPATTSITMIATDNKFDQTALTVPANQTITLRLENRGQAIHDWTVTISGREIRTRLLSGGQSDTITFTATQTGSYEFKCSVHPTEMRGILFVQ